jgi:hypothetical protein
MPDPEDSVEQTPDEYLADEPYPDAAPGHHQRAAAEHDEAAFEPHADYRAYTSEGPYADDLDAEGEHYPADDAYRAGTADEYPEFPPRRPGPVASEPPPPRAGHRGLGDWRGGHRSEGGRRGVSIGVIVALVAVVVVVGTVIL